MTSYPVTGDAFGSMERADGTTTLHSSEHGSTIDIAVNAKQYLRGDGTTESASQISALRTAGLGKRVYFPAGTYVFPDGTSFGDLSSHTHVFGAGRQICTITVKDAYAFTGTAPNDARVEGFYIVSRSGATTGGGVKFDSASACKLHSLYVESVSTQTEPSIWMKGSVGSHIDDVLGGGATAPGIRMDAAGATLAFNNANTVYRSRVVSVQGSTTPGVYSTGGGGNKFRDNIIESNRGYGLQLVGETADVVEGNWFEDNSNHNIYISGGSITTQVTGNKIHYNHGEILTAEHIKLEGSANGRHMIRIEGNQFQDPSASGTAIDIGSGVEFTSVIANRGVGKSNGTTIVDNGSYTTILWNDSASTRYDDVKLPLTNSSGLGGRVIAGSGGVFTVKGDTQTGDNGDVTASGLFAVADAAGDEVFGVTRKGYPTFKTLNGDPGSGLLPTNAFLFYWDESTQKVKVRYRNNSGSESTAALF